MSRRAGGRQRPGVPGLLDGPPVRLRGASVGYGDRTVVHEVDLEVRTGERVAVLGSNGSGKTTLLRGLLGLAARTGGSIEMFGAPAPSRASRRRTGYVPQAMTVGGGIPTTVREVVAAGRLPLRPWWRPATAADRAAVQDALDAVDMREHAREDIAELSGGQQRRVLIARALAADPDLLVLDEPLAGVDAASSVALAGTLQALAAREVTLLVVTHEIGPLVDVVDRAVVVQQGRIAYDGPLRPELLGASDGADLAGLGGAAGGHLGLDRLEHVHHDGDTAGSPGPAWLHHPSTGGDRRTDGAHPERHIRRDDPRAQGPGQAQRAGTGERSGEV